MYPGFKLGGGQFTQFTFSVPALLADPEAIAKSKEKQ